MSPLDHTTVSWFISLVLHRIGCGWAWPLMAAVREGSITDDQMNDSMHGHFKPSDDEARPVPEKLGLWMAQNYKRFGTRRGDALLLFMAWGCNRGMMITYMKISLVYIVSRAASQFMYSGLINALGDNWPPSIYALFHPSGNAAVHTRPRLLSAAVLTMAVLFSFASVLAAYVSYKLDKQGKECQI